METRTGDLLPTVKRGTHLKLAVSVSPNLVGLPRGWEMVPRTLSMRCHVGQDRVVGSLQPQMEQSGVSGVNFVCFSCCVD